MFQILVRAWIVASSLFFVSGVGAEDAEVKVFKKDSIHPGIFESANAEQETIFGASATNVPLLYGSDGAFLSGLYQCEAVEETHIDEPYGVDEFMYFLSGSVTLTSVDGTITEIGPGDAVAIPKEWRGTWSSPGYSKLWVVYDAASKESP